MNQYDNCFSLGWFCGTASALSKLGLRTRSGPFDWYFLDYWAVLNIIENDFRDFMKKENLELIDGWEGAFKDKKYDFICNHDIHEDFEIEYSDIYAKYCRRAEIFKTEILKPTVFFRCIKDDAEISFINDNWKYAESVIKKYNAENRIVYVHRKGLENLTTAVQSYCLDIPEYIGETFEMRNLFDTSKKLVDFCSNILPDKQKLDNRAFDRMHNAEKLMRLFLNKCFNGKGEGLDKVILHMLNATKDEGIYIFGGGGLGKAMVKYLERCGVKIKGIIDNNYRIYKDTYEFNILPFETLKNGDKVFVAVYDEKINCDIEQQILDNIQEVNIVKYTDLYEIVGEII